MGRTESWPENDYERAYGWKSKSNTLYESEMALFFERMQQSAQKVFDTGRHCQRCDVTTVSPVAIVLEVLSNEFPNLGFRFVRNLDTLGIKIKIFCETQKCC